MRLPKNNMNLPTHKKTLLHHADRLSDKLVNVIHNSHKQKVILHTRKNVHLVRVPLLFGIILTLLLPILMGFALTVFLYYGGNLMVEKEE